MATHQCHGQDSVGHGVASLPIRALLNITPPKKKFISAWKPKGDVSREMYRTLLELRA